MTLKTIYQLATRIDKWAHLAGAFMLTTLAIRWLGAYPQGTGVAVYLVVMGSVFIELYQRLDPDYPLKRADTVLDLIADGIGIALAVWIWNG